MYQAIAEVEKAFKQRNLKYHVLQQGSHWILRSSMSGDASTYDFLFIKADESGNDVAMRIFKLAKFPQHKRSAARELLNQFQQEYRFIRFVLDDDGDVNIEYDFPAAYQPIGKGCVEMFFRTTKILDICYRRLMQAAWS